MGTGLLAGISPRVKKTCADLVGDDARLPAEVARTEGVSIWAIFKRRRRFETKLGVRLPRLHRIGRPIKAASLSIAN